MLAHLPQRRLDGLAPAPLRLSEDCKTFLEGDGEQLRLGLEAATVRSHLEIGAVAAVLDSDDLARFGVGADGPGQRKDLQGLVHRDGLERHRGEERAGRRFLFAPFLPVLEGPNLDVRTEAASFGVDLESVLGMHTEDAALLRHG